MKKIILYSYLVVLSIILSVILFVVFFAINNALADDLKIFNPGFLKIIVFSIWAVAANLISIIYTIKLIETDDFKLKNVILANIFSPSIILIGVLQILISLVKNMLNI